MSDSDLTITITAARDYRPSSRVASAIRELEAALEDAHGAETTGFKRQHKPLMTAGPMEEVSFVFHTITWTVVGGGLEITAGDDWENQV
jgi:hypothetical protein